MESKAVSISSVIEVLLKLNIVRGSRKYAAKIILHKPGNVVLREFLDDGKGHSGALSEKDTPIDFGVFERLRSEQFISGVMEIGYVSKEEFVLSRRGRDRLQEYFAEKRTAKI